MRQWLKDIRVKKGLTTYEVAATAGISQSLYSSIENGSRGVTVAKAKKIAAALGFEWAKFYEEMEE